MGMESIGFVISQLCETGGVPGLDNREATAWGETVLKLTA